MKCRSTLFVFLVACLPSCASRSTTQSDATFLSARPHQLVLQMDSTGTFNNQRLVPLSDAVKVTVAGKVVSVQQLRQGQRVRISRDDETHEVVAIEGL